MNMLLLIMDIIGLSSFLVAAFYSFNNNSKLGLKSFSVWIYLAAASILASIWCFNFALNDAGIQLEFVEESVLFFSVSFIFMMVAIGSRLDFIKPK